MDLAILASAYSSGRAVGSLLAVAFVAGGILHFWKRGPSKEELAPRQAPQQRTLGTYGQPVEPAQAPVPVPPAKAQSGGRPAWAAPVVWGIAAIVGIALVASHKDPDKVTDKDKRDIVAGCLASRGPAFANACQCLADQLVAEGIDTKSKMRDLALRMRDAVTTNSPQSIPPEMLAAAQACRAEQPQQSQ